MCMISTAKRDQDEPELVDDVILSAQHPPFQPRRAPETMQRGDELLERGDVSARSGVRG